ncbi:hypothetical protein BA022_15960 [Diaphorobacter nitroreducens]|uniref:hypothetical protein n=1 Tax=Diaphorobacter nitroreducens TaxID=164759 RepID=UPI000DC71659|nr:hypothetical protein [Diaphorobacter nitroreducens]ASI69912.1 hypothetical protein BA022_15960 [Diaphorobacter nitroreducens]
MAVARYWRIVGIAVRGGGDLELSGLHLYGAAGRLDTVAVLSASIAPTAGQIDALQDGVTTTTCRFPAAAVQSPGFALVWDFAGAPADVTGLRLGSSDVVDTFPAGLLLQSSSDAAVWNTVLVINRQIVWPGPRSMTVTVTDMWVENWFESFDAGIPPGFASVLTDSGALAVAHDAAKGAVSLDATGYNTAWMFNLAGPQIGLRLEFDLEIVVPTYNNNPMIGLVLSGGPQLLQNILSVGGTAAVSYRSASATDLALVSPPLASGAMPASNPSSGRTQWAFSSAPAPDGLARNYVFAVAGNELVLNHGHTAATTALKPGLFLRSCKVLLHSVRGYYLAMAGTEALPVRAFERGLRRVVQAPVGAFQLQSVFGTRVARDVEFGGAGRIWGTTKTKATPSNLPTKARVVLLHQRSKQLVRETWSDPVTGAFAFEGIDTEQEFLTLAEDAAGAYRPVAANRLVPEVTA